MENNEFFQEVKFDELIEFNELDIEERKKQYQKSIIEKGFLPVNDEYEETMHTSMEFVEENPKKFIIEECIPACKELWSKNIYTFMVSDYDDEKTSWIEVVYDSLSDENKEIYNKLSAEKIIKFSYHIGCVNFGVKYIGKKAQIRLLELAQQFKMQDVPYGEAYITLPEFLIRCGCYDEVENPNYELMIEPYKMIELPLEQKIDYIKKYDEWELSDRSKKKLRVFNPNKMTKPLEEYVSSEKVIYADDRIYLSEYHYQKHQNYIKNITKKSKIKHKVLNTNEFFN